MAYKEKTMPLFYYIDKQFNTPDEFSSYILKSIKNNKRGIIIDSSYKAYDVVANYAHDSITPLIGRIKYIIEPTNKTVEENKENIKKILKENYIIVFSVIGLDTDSKRKLLKSIFESVLELDINHELDFILGYNTFIKCFTEYHSEKLKSDYIEKTQNQNIEQIYYEEKKYRLKM